MDVHYQKAGEIAGEGTHILGEVNESTAKIGPIECRSRNHLFKNITAQLPKYWAIGPNYRNGAIYRAERHTRRRA